jgi:hypothetical protein
MSISHKEIIREQEILTEMKYILSEYCSIPHIENNKNNSVLKKTTELLKEIKLRISHFCEHDIVEDYIDTCVDKSVRILYCVKCETTF